MRNIVKGLVPKIVILNPKRDSSEIESVNENSDADLVNKAVDWWRDSKYTEIKRYRALRWLGVNWIKIPFYESIKDNYFVKTRKVSQKFVSVIDEMITKGIISSINADSKVFEGGSNVGVNLFTLQEKYGCEVTGLDISKDAINIAKSDIWKDRERFEFIVDNALTTDYFSKIEDDYFDLAYTKWHLTHIPLSEEKKAYVKEMIRVSKNFVIVEGYKGEHDTTLHHGGTYSLSFDDWEKEYGLACYGDFDEATRIYYKKKNH